MGTLGAMGRYAALLRGITPSNPNMTNDKLRGVFEGLGLGDVTSVLASGNIVFRSAESDVPVLEERIQAALVRELGIGGGTIIREHAELRALLDRDPFAGLSHDRSTYLTVTFLKDRAAVKVAAAAPEHWPERPDPLTRGLGYDPAARVILAVLDNTTTGTPSGVMSWLEKTCGKDITTRTWLTVQRIVRKMESA